MGTEAERQDTRKAMAFDLCNIIDEDPSQETYTKEEIKKMGVKIIKNNYVIVEDELIRHNSIKLATDIFTYIIR